MHWDDLDLGKNNYSKKQQGEFLSLACALELEMPLVSHDVLFNIFRSQDGWLKNWKCGDMPDLYKIMDGGIVGVECVKVFGESFVDKAGRIQSIDRQCACVQKKTVDDVVSLFADKKLTDKEFGKIENRFAVLNDIKWSIKSENRHIALRELTRYHVGQVGEYRSELEKLFHKKDGFRKVGLLIEYIGSFCELVTFDSGFQFRCNERGFSVLTDDHLDCFNSVLAHGIDFVVFCRSEEELHLALSCGSLDGITLVVDSRIDYGKNVYQGEMVYHDICSCIYLESKNDNCCFVINTKHFWAGLLDAIFCFLTGILFCSNMEMVAMVCTILSINDMDLLKFLQDVIAKRDVSELLEFIDITDGDCRIKTFEPHISQFWDLFETFYGQLLFQKSINIVSENVCVKFGQFYICGTYNRDGLVIKNAGGNIVEMISTRSHWDNWTCHQLDSKL